MNSLFRIYGNESQILFTSTNYFYGFRVECPTTKILHKCALSFQNNLNVMSLEKGNFKFSIGSINDKFFHVVPESLKIL